MRMPLAVLLIVLWPWWVRPELLALGILVSAIGEFLQVWCFACIEKEKVLTIRGPYQICRNPMYLGRYLLILGFVLLLGSWPIAAGYTVVYWFYMVNRVKREEPVLEGIFGNPYREYCREVNRFMPGFRRLDPDFWFFRWSIMISNNGHWNLLSAVAGYLYIVLMLKYVL